MPRTLGYLAAIASDNVVSVCLGLERISRPAQAKSEVVQGVVGASPRSCAQRPRTQAIGELPFHICLPFRIEPHLGPPSSNSYSTAIPQVGKKATLSTLFQK